jgi:tRNA-(ms[2]io[6]A)-hydroxylase
MEQETGTHAMIKLQYDTPLSWAQGVVDAIDLFLPDHAAAEKKASSMAMGMVSHYPDRPELVTAMIDLAIEELNHYRAVVKVMNERGLRLLPDEKDPYVNRLRGAIRKGKEFYFMDRLLVAGIIEARGAERFGLVADALPSGRLKQFYRAITKSEEEHQGLFIELAELYFDPEQTRSRLNELLRVEADIVRELPLRPALH